MIQFYRMIKKKLFLINENKTNINYLPCIYTVHRLNPNKICFLANEILQVLIKNMKSLKYMLKYAHF